MRFPLPLRLASPLLLLVLAACEPTPAYLERWANRDGSEEMFVEHLHNPDVSQEVRTKALELLIDQWEYSSSLFSNGRVLRDMPDATVRDATIAAVVPHLQARLQNEVTRTPTRDAVYQIRLGTDSETVRAQLADLLMGFVNSEWQPCLESAGLVSVPQIFTELGPELITPRLLAVIESGTFDELLCMRRTVGSSVPWIHESEAVAAALITRWDAGRLSDVPQFNFEMLEFMLSFKDVPALRTWVFGRVADPNFDPLFKNVCMDWLRVNPSDADQAQYVGLLTNERNTRWAAVQSLVERGGSDGLRTVLTSLPTTGEYGFYDGEVRPDGLKSVAERVFCTMTKLQEIGDNARRVFEETLASPNPYARAISLTCLKTFGDAQTVAAVTTFRDGLGRAPVPVPSYGEGATFQALADEVITAINARLAAPR